MNGSKSIDVAIGQFCLRKAPMMLLFVGGSPLVAADSALEICGGFMVESFFEFLARTLMDRDRSTYASIT